MGLISIPHHSGLSHPDFYPLQSTPGSHCSSCSPWPHTTCPSSRCQTRCQLPDSKMLQKGQGAARTPHPFGQQWAESPSNTSLSLFPAKTLSNVEGVGREGRRLHKIGAEKRLVAGEGAAAGAGGARGTARRVTNRMVSLQHGASHQAGRKGNRKGMVG